MQISTGGKKPSLELYEMLISNTMTNKKDRLRDLIGRMRAIHKTAQEKVVVASCMIAKK